MQMPVIGISFSVLFFKAKPGSDAGERCTAQGAMHCPAKELSLITLHTSVNTYYLSMAAPVIV